MIRRLVAYTIAVVCLLCPQVRANQVHSNVSTVKSSIVKQSIELGIDPALALSIAKSESGFRHESTSAHGAVGVFQLMPSTAKRLGVNPYYLSGNIKGGLVYYKRMYDMFGSTELALAAYNAGPSVVKRYNKVPPIYETKRFVSNIMQEYYRQKAHPDPEIRKLKTSKPVKQIKFVNTKHSVVFKASLNKPLTIKGVKTTNHVVLKTPLKQASKPVVKPIKRNVDLRPVVLTKYKDEGHKKIPLQGIV